jgi:hypothetical protein
MARARHTAKRDAQTTPMTESLKFIASNDRAFLRLNDALDDLAAASPLKSRLIELRWVRDIKVEVKRPEPPRRTQSGH